MVPRHRHAALPRPPAPGEEPTHGEIFEAIMEVRERMERMEEELHRIR